MRWVSERFCEQIFDVQVLPSQRQDRILNPQTSEQSVDVSAAQMVACEPPINQRCTELQIHENDVVFPVDHDDPGLFLCIREGFGPYDGRIQILRTRATWESGSRQSRRNFALLSTGHVIDVVADILLNNGTMFHAGDRAIVTTICEEHVELKFGDNTVDVSRGWWPRLRAPSLDACGEEDVGGKASRGQMPS